MRRRVAVAVASMIVALAVAGLSISSTIAAWTDTGRAVSGSFGALARLTTPTLSCSVLGVASVGFSWSPVPGATEYEFSITPTGGQTTTTTYPSTQTSTSRVGLVATGTVTVRARHSYPSTSWFSDPSNPVNYTVAAVTLCA